MAHLFRSCLTQDQIRVLETSIVAPDQVNYIQVQTFIDSIVLPFVAQQLKWDAAPIYNKFRFSNGNNSIDALAFHRDTYNYTKDGVIVPLYTVIVYINPTVMEVIPDTNFHNEYRLSDISSLRSKITRLEIPHGSILVFPATLLHRGVFHLNKKDRKVLQIFDVYPTRDIYDKFYDKLLLAKFPQTKMGYFSYIIGKSRILSNIFVWLHFYIVILQVQYSLVWKDIPHKARQMYYVTNEPGLQGTLTTELQPMNRNIHVHPYAHVAYPTDINIIPLLFVVILGSVLFVWLRPKFTKSNYAPPSDLLPKTNADEILINRRK
jgi:hypothetical protein